MRVALETTILVHGVPAGAGLDLARRLGDAVRGAGGTPATTAVLGGEPVVGVGDAQLAALLARDPKEVVKVNTANLGVALHRGLDAATTVSTTLELAASAGIRVSATGGIGGVHHGGFDVSCDLLALSRFPVCIVASGVKSILDVRATREALETLGVPVIGYRTDEFPAFYLRRCPEGSVGVDARFDEAEEIAEYARGEMMRTGRGVLVCNPAPEEHAIDAATWDDWLHRAHALVRSHGDPGGRDVTPALLAALHEVSGGKTLETNIALAVSNAGVAGRIAASIGHNEGL